MAGSGRPQPKRPNPPKTEVKAPRKPLQVVHISRRQDKTDSQPPKREEEESFTNTAEGESNPPSKDSFANYKNRQLEDPEGISMADLLGPIEKPGHKELTDSDLENPLFVNRSLDDYDFDEDAFLAALDENEPIGTTGEIAKGAVISTESDGVYVDIGGKAPGFMPKNECGLGVIPNLKERFPKGLEVEVLVTREQNADGMVTISCRALALRKSWDKVSELQKQGKVVEVKVNGFNRGGLTCDLEGLRGFIPRSQLQNGDTYQDLVTKTLKVAFLEANPDTRKLVLSEKRAAVAERFSSLEIGQLVNGKIVAVKPYGFFIDLGGVSGLLHHSMITGGSLRSLREIFDNGEEVKALITDLDPGRGRIGLNTALLENQPGELLTEKDKVLSEIEERAQRARSLLVKKKQEEGTLNAEKVSKDD